MLSRIYGFVFGEAALMLAPSPSYMAAKLAAVLFVPSFVLVNVFIVWRNSDRGYKALLNSTECILKKLSKLHYPIVHLPWYKRQKTMQVHVTSNQDLFGTSSLSKVGSVMFWSAIYGIILSTFISYIFMFKLLSDSKRKDQEIKDLKKYKLELETRVRALREAANKVHVSYPLGKLVEKGLNDFDTQAYRPGVLECSKRK